MKEEWSRRKGPAPVEGPARAIRPDPAVDDYSSVVMSPWTPAVAVSLS